MEKEKFLVKHFTLFTFYQFNNCWILFYHIILQLFNQIPKISTPNRILKRNNFTGSVNNNKKYQNVKMLIIGFNLYINESCGLTTKSFAI